MGKREKDDNTAKTETKVDTVHSMNPAGEGLNGIKASLSDYHSCARVDCRNSRERDGEGLSEGKQDDTEQNWSTTS